MSFSGSEVRRFDTGLKSDTISELTAAVGVTVDGVLLKDSQVSVDAIVEGVGLAGVDIDSVLLKDGAIQMVKVAAPTNVASKAYLYLDTADDLLKCKINDDVVQIVATSQSDASVNLGPNFTTLNCSAAATLCTDETQACTLNGIVTCVNGLIPKSNRASAITAAATLSADDSGGVFSVAKTSAYAITLPTPAQGMKFKFLVLDTGSFAVTISDGSAHLDGMVSVNNVSIVMTGTTINLVSGGVLGDWVMFEGIDATHYLVTGACKDAGDITVS